MSGSWKIVNIEESLISPLDKKISDTRARFKNPPTDEKKLRTHLAEWESVSKIAGKIAQLTNSSDPLREFMPVYEDNGDLIPGFYRLRVNSLTAYYRVDERSKLCVGILFSDETQSKPDALKEILTAAYEKHSPKGPGK
jgi:hypothetical protein